MKLITRDTDYAIRALCYIAKHKRMIVNVGDLVRKLKIPRPFLRKILQKLNKESLLKSYKGMGGGFTFTLTLTPDRILVTDIIRIFQGEIKLSEHIFKKSACPHVKTCVLKKRLDKIEKHVVDELKNITIASLARDVEDN